MNVLKYTGFYYHPDYFVSNYYNRKVLYNECQDLILIIEKYATRNLFRGVN